MDEHCAFRNSPLLQKVFGVRTSPATAGKVVAATGDPDLRPDGAQAQLNRNGKPELLVNRYGKGQAWLLNYFHHTYSNDKLNAANGPALDNLRKVLSQSGIAPRVSLTGADGSPVSGCERYLFNNGTTRLLGLVPGMERPAGERIEVRLDGDYAIYDVRRKRFLGTGDRFLTVIEPGKPELFAFVSGRITGLNLRSPGRQRSAMRFPLNFRLPVRPTFVRSPA